MKNFLSRALVFVAILATLGATNVARAAVLNFFDALALIQSTATDTDAYFFTLFTNNEGTLNYTSVSTATTWTGALSGAGLAINYLSTDLSNLPLGPVTWASTGSFGALTWTGSGSASITDTSATTFNEMFSDSVMLGSNTASINVTIPGTLVAGNTVMFGDPMNPEVDAAGSGFVNGVALAKKIYSYSKDKDGNLTQSDIQFVPDDDPPKKFKDNLYDANGNMLPFTLVGSISAVPEPSAGQLLALGTLALLGLGRRHRRRAS